MDNSQVLKLADELKRAHGFENVPVVFARTKSALGRAWWRGGLPFKIDLSSYWMRYLPEADVRDTILHEIAHLMAGPWAGHGSAWVNACVKIGANPSRVADLPESLMLEVKEKISKYKAVCRKCGEVHHFNRFTKRWQRNLYRCGVCNGEFKVV